MSSERRFSQKEIAAIFNRASKAQEKVNEEAAQEEGLTLADLHLIALEAGISPDLITQAVVAVDETPEEPKPKKFLGLQISVSKTVNLDNPLTDDDWDKIVVELRNTFSAKGKISIDGSLREWSNGNLRVLVEPTSKGNRLHMTTQKGSTPGAIMGSLSFILAAIFIFVSSAIAGALDNGVIGVGAMFAAAGVIFSGFLVLQLSQWRFDRLEQFESIASKALKMTSNFTVAENLSEKKKSKNAEDAKNKLGSSPQKEDPSPADRSDYRIEGHHGRSRLMDGVDHEEEENAASVSRNREKGR